MTGIRPHASRRTSDERRPPRRASWIRVIDGRGLPRHTSAAGGGTTREASMSARMVLALLAAVIAFLSAPTLMAG
jgi:hypothetical protein